MPACLKSPAPPSPVSIKTHYSAAELAALKLPGLPATERGNQLLAKREGWASRKRAGRGGGREYALDALPIGARDCLRARVARQLLATGPVVAPAPAWQQPALREPVSLTGRQQGVEAARMGVLTAIERLMGSCGLSKERAMQHLLASVQTGQADALTVAMLKRACDERGRRHGDGLPGIRTLKRWFARREACQLAPKVRQTDLSLPWWARDFLGHWQQPQKPSVELAYRLFVAGQLAQDPERELPSIHVIRRFLRKLGTVSREAGRLEARELKRLQPFVRRDFADLLPNDVWSADGHCFDAEVQHPLTGRPFRPEITSIIDIATRRVVGWSIDLAESGLAVLDALRMAVGQAGTPAIFYVDNGSGYVNALMKDEGTGLMGRLGISMSHSVAYNSQARGVIERLHQTLWVSAAKQLPSYIGADMDRQARQRQFRITRAAVRHGGRLPMMGWDDFLAFAGERVAEYNARPHASLKKRSPDAVWTGFEQRGWQAQREDDATLERLFRPRLERTVDRGQVRLFNNVYFSTALTELHGESVQVAYDIHEAERVWVYLPDGRFVCHADWNANRTAYFARPVIEQKRAARAEAALRRLDERRDAVEAERDGRAALAPVTAPVLPGLAGRDIAGAFERLDAIDVPAAVEAAPRRLAPAPASDDFSVPPTPALRYRAWLTLEARTADGTPLTAREARWLASYARSHEFNVMKQTGHSDATA